MTVRAETHRVTCPLCLVGYTNVFLEVVGTGGNQEVRVPEIRSPHKCESCHRYFRIKMQMQLVGVPLEDARPLNVEVAQ